MGCARHLVAWSTRSARTCTTNLALPRRFPCKCDVCLKGKSERQGIGRVSAAPWRVAQAPMGKWYVDIIGPMSTFDEKTKKKRRILSHTGKRYQLVIVDEYSRYTMGANLRNKSEAPHVIITLIKTMQVKTGKTLANLHVDGDREFLTKELRAFLAGQGTELTTTTPNTPSLNGVVEKMNDRLTTMATCMRLQCDGPELLWDHAMNYSIFVQDLLAQHWRRSPAKADVPHRRYETGQGQGIWMRCIRA